MLIGLNTKPKQNKTVINNRGFALISLLITVFIIAAFSYGIFHFTKSGSREVFRNSNGDELVTPQGQIEALQKAEKVIGDFEQQNKEREKSLKAQE